LRRSFLGYRPRDVREALAARDRSLAARDARIVELEAVAKRLSERVVDRERELRELREELADLHAESEDGLRSIAALGRQLEELRAQARGQATRIRISALRDAAELSERVSELAKRPGEAGGQLLETVQEAIGRLSDQGDADLERGAVGRGPRPANAESNGQAEREPEELFEGLIHVEVGPLTDFSQLVLFEDAANGIGATSEISVTRFSEGRATLAMRLQEPVQLLRELEERCDLEFKVRSKKGDHVVLDVDEEPERD
jgi:Skp family chaperone for outer membrane proteins